MSNTQQSPDPIVYVPTPISEPPKEDGWYDFVDLSGEDKAMSAYFLDGDFFESEEEARENENHDAIDVDEFHWLRPTPLSSLLKDKQKRIEELEAERDNFAISFAGWVISPEGQMYLATKMSASQLLKTYKDRPYINIDSSKQ